MNYPILKDNKRFIILLHLMTLVEVYSSKIQRTHNFDELVKKTITLTTRFISNKMLELIINVFRFIVNCKSSLEKYLYID